MVVTAVAADPAATVRTLEGESVKGKVAKLSAAILVVKTSTGTRELPTSQIMWVEWPVSPPLDKPSVWLDLLDGSRLVAQTFTSAGGQARVELAGGQTIELPTRAIHTVRFRQQTPELAVQWREITSSMATGDMVVMRRTSMRTIEQGENEPQTVTEQALDQLEGTLLDVTPESVLFDVDGDKVPVRREKLEGLVYFHPAKREFSQPVCKLLDAGGSSWLLRDVQLGDGRIAATSLGGVALELPLVAVAKVDFSVGNIAFLTELEADLPAGESPRSLQPPAMTFKFNQLLKLRSGPPPGASQFRIGGQPFDKGQTLHGATKLVYRVPEGFRSFRAVAGVDDVFTSPGRFDLVILGDGKELLRQEFPLEGARRGLAIDLDVRQVRRITIALETASGQDIGDQLDLCEARFTK
jgi:hypothetical protein